MGVIQTARHVADCARTVDSASQPDIPEISNLPHSRTKSAATITACMFVPASVAHGELLRE